MSTIERQAHRSSTGWARMDKTSAATGKQTTYLAAPPLSLLAAHPVKALRSVRRHLSETPPGATIMVSTIIRGKNTNWRKIR